MNCTFLVPAHPGLRVIKSVFLLFCQLTHTHTEKTDKIAQPLSLSDVIKLKGFHFMHKRLTLCKTLHILPNKLHKTALRQVGLTHKLPEIKNGTQICTWCSEYHSILQRKQLIKCTSESLKNCPLVQNMWEQPNSSNNISFTSISLLFFDRTSCAGGRHNMPSPLQFDLWPWKWWPSPVWRGLCANFSLPRPLCSRLRPDVRDRQTSDAHHRLMPNNQLPVLASGATTHPWPHDWDSVHRPCWGLHSRPQYRLAFHACHVFHQLVNPAFSTGHNLIWTVYHASTGRERLH